MKNKSASQSVLICLFTVLAFAVYTSPAWATSTNWRVTAGDWSTCNNWDNGCPDSSTDAYINNAGKAQIYSGTAATAHNLTLGDITTDSGAVLVDGTGSLDVPSCDNLGSRGIIYVGNQGVGSLSITNGGTVASGGGYIAESANSNGAVTVSGASSTWAISSSCGNPANLIIGGTPEISGGIGLLTITNGGAVTVDNQTHQIVVAVRDSGTLAGNGTITVTGPINTTIGVSGTLAPNGQLTVDGYLLLNPNATTHCNVTPTSNDSVVVSGVATLNGRLTVTMTGTFTSGNSSPFTLLSADGGFNNATFQSVSISYPTNQGFTPYITYDSGNKVYLNLIWNE